MYNRLMSPSEIKTEYGNCALEKRIEEAEIFINSESVEENYPALRIEEFKNSLELVKTQLNDSTESMARINTNLNLMYERLEVTEEPIITFDAFTYTHIGPGSDSVDNLIDAYKDRVFLSPQSKVITNSGDFTDNGEISEYDDYFNINNLYAGIPFITAIGNHEARWNCLSGPTQNTNPYEGTCVNNDSVFAQRYLDYNSPYMTSETLDGSFAIL